LVTVLAKRLRPVPVASGDGAAVEGQRGAGDESAFLPCRPNRRGGWRQGGVKKQAGTNAT
jgi:hypothetical protein